MYPQIPKNVNFVWSGFRNKPWFSEAVAGTDVQGRATKALGLTYDQGEILFHPDPADNWPEPFASRWAESKRIKRTVERRTVQARIAADYLNYIIKTGKVT